VSDTPLLEAAAIEWARERVAFLQSEAARYSKEAERLTHSGEPMTTEATITIPLDQYQQMNQIVTLTDQFLRTWSEDVLDELRDAVLGCKALSDD